MCPVTRFFAVQTISSFWWDLENFHKKVPSYTFCSLWRLSQKFSQKVCPVTHFVRCGDYLKNFHKKVCPVTHFVRCGDYFKFWMALRKVPTNMCAQLHVFSQCRLSQVFDGTWKTFHKKVCPVTRFVRCGDYFKFWMALRKVPTNMCAQLHVFSQCRLSQVFDGTWKTFTKKCPVTRFVLCGDYLKNFHKKCAQLHILFAVETISKIFTKKCAQLHILFAVETILSFGWHLEKFPQICVPNYTFFRSADYLKFLMGLGKLFTKKCAQLHVLFAVETILSFGWHLEKFPQICVPSYTFFRSADYLKFLMGLGKLSQKSAQLHVLFSVETISKIFTKSVPSYTFCSLWRLS